MVCMESGAAEGLRHGQDKEIAVYDKGNVTYIRNMNIGLLFVVEEMEGRLRCCVRQRRSTSWLFDCSIEMHQTEEQWRTEGCGGDMLVVAEWLVDKEGILQYNTVSDKDLI